MAEVTEADREKALTRAYELFYCNAATEGCASIRCSAYGKCQNFQEMHAQDCADARAEAYQRVVKGLHERANAAAVPGLAQATQGQVTALIEAANWVQTLNWEPPQSGKEGESSG